MDLTRRSFLAGIGAVSVGLLFRRKLDAVLDSLEQDLIAEQQAENQLPSAVDIVVQPARAFRPERVIVSQRGTAEFVIEDIKIGNASQMVEGAPIPADIFTANATDLFVNFDPVVGGMEIRFRVRYIGSDPKGARFQAALIGTDGRGHKQILPIDSGVEIVA